MFGYRHVMQRHLARKHPREQDSAEQSAVESAKDPESTVARTTDEPSIMDLLTGKHYSKPLTTSRNIQRSLHCPWPNIAAAGSGTPISGVQCTFIFSRVYDLRRHLRSEHGLEIEQEILDAIDLMNEVHRA